jgi:DNA-binding response OmpR family regulator
MTESFDLVIMDVVLPDGSGLDLLTEIDRNTQVLIFSSHEPHRRVAEQVATVLMKSLTNSHSLLATIKEIIGLE